MVGLSKEEKDSFDNELIELARSLDCWEDIIDLEGKAYSKIANDTIKARRVALYHREENRDRNI